MYNICKLYSMLLIGHLLYMLRSRCGPVKCIFPRIVYSTVLCCCYCQFVIVVMFQSTL